MSATIMLSRERGVISSVVVKTHDVYRYCCVSVHGRECCRQCCERAINSRKEVVRYVGRNGKNKSLRHQQDSNLRSQREIDF